MKLPRIFNRKVASKPTGQRMLKGASGGKRWRNVPAFGSTGPEVLAGARAVRGRARHLRQNDPHAANGAEILKTALVGPGAIAASTHDDSDCRTCLESGFASWGARTHWPALQGEIAEELVTAGESFIIMRQNDDGELTLQHIPPEQVDEAYTVDLTNGRIVVSGIEYLDGNDDPKAYYIRPASPHDQFQAFREPIRIDAEDVIHIYRRQGAGQTRGLSWFAPVIIALNEKAQLKDALLVNAKIQSMMVGFVTDLTSVGGGTSPFDDGESPDLSLEPGTMRILPAGYDVKFSTPQAAQAANETAASALREIACGLGIPDFMLGGDFSNVNYSSARTALIQFRGHIEAAQRTILAPAFNRIYERWQLLESLRGNPHADPDSKCTWVWHAPAWVDPRSEAIATREKLNMGLISRKMAVAELGFDVTKVDAEIAADRERESELGLSFGQKKGNP